MPNGLASASRIFTKLLLPIYAHIRQHGHESFGDFDGSFVMADTFDKAKFQQKLWLKL